MYRIFHISLVILIVLGSVLPVLAEPAFSCADVTEIPQVECEALVAFYNATNGPEWYYKYGWLVTNTPSNWFGVTVTSGHVTAIHFWTNNLKGNLPVELGNLTDINSLLLEYDELSGDIPPWLGNLTSLTELHLNGNLLSGDIPTELGNLVNLQSLYLHDNLLTGNIPHEFGNLASLQDLRLGENQLIGNIPAELGNLANLQGLLLDNNQLTGSIPSELGNLTDLVGIDLFSNQLSGGIPAVLGNLANLQTLWLFDNLLTGTVPASLGNLANLQSLWLSDNLLTGSIPPQLGNLTNLWLLDLSGNQLTGTIPVELGNLINLNILGLQENLLSGDIPPNLTNLVYLYDPGQFGEQAGLDLDYNLLTVPLGYPDPPDPLQVFLNQKDPDWQLRQGFEQPIGSGGGEIISLDGRTDLLFSPGAVISDTTFTFLPRSGPSQDHFGLGFAQNSFLLSAVDGLGNPVTAFSLPVTVTISYTDADFGGMQEDLLRLYYWDETSGNWLDAVTTCPGEYTRDLAGDRFALPLCHLTEFGVFGIPLRMFIPVVNR